MNISIGSLAAVPALSRPDLLAAPVAAALAALVLVAVFRSELEGQAPKGYDINSLFHLTSPDVLIGLIIGGMMVYLFVAFAIEAVGRTGGEVVEEVRSDAGGDLAPIK